MTPYAILTEAEQWAWHAEVYAFRRIVLNVPMEQVTSPCDPDGKWYNEAMIRVAAERLQAKRNAARRLRESARDAELIADGRELCNRWARQNGFADFAEAERAGSTHADVIRALPAAGRKMRTRRAAEL